MNSYERIGKIEELMIAKDMVLAEVIPLKKKSLIIGAGTDDDIDRHGLKVVKVNHSETTNVPELEVDDIILFCISEPLNGFEHKGKKYLLLRSSSIGEFTSLENYNCRIV